MRADLNYSHRDRAHCTTAPAALASGTRVSYPARAASSTKAIGDSGNGDDGLPFRIDWFAEHALNLSSAG